MYIYIYIYIHYWKKNWGAPHFLKKTLKGYIFVFRKKFLR